LAERNVTYARNRERGVNRVHLRAELTVSRTDNQATTQLRLRELSKEARRPERTNSTMRSLNEAIDYYEAELYGEVR